jgi:hypothetical protein
MSGNNSCSKKSISDGRDVNLLIAGMPFRVKGIPKPLLEPVLLSE